MEPHSVDPSHDLAAPHHDGVYGPLLWVDVASGEVRPDASSEPGTRVKALVVWVGMPVVTVSEGVTASEFANVSQSLREFLRRPSLPVVFALGWLPEKVGAKMGVVAAQSVSRRELARAAAYLLVQAAWLARETVTIELEGQTFHFEVRESLDEAGRVLTVIR